MIEIMLPLLSSLWLLEDVAAPRKIEENNLRQLLAVKRVYVDRLGGGETASQVRDMLISSLLNSKLFAVTENQERADAFIRGSAEDLVFTDTFQSSEGINARASVGAGGASSTRSASGATTSKQPGVNLSVGENESTHIAERKHEASAAVRLVNKDGDVIWSTTQESLGGKFRGASADVAGKIAKQLIADFERAKKLPDAATSAPAPASGGTSPR